MHSPVYSPVRPSLGAFILLLLCTAWVGPAHAQGRWQLAVQAGDYLRTDMEVGGYDPAVPALSLSLARALGPAEEAGAFVRGVGTLSKLGGSNCPPPPRPQLLPPQLAAIGEWSLMDAGAVQWGVADVGARLPLGQRFRAEAFGGAGIRRVGAGTPDPQRPESYAFEASTHPVLAYGGTAYVALTRRLAASVQLRGMSFFQGDQTLVPANGPAVTLDFGRFDNAVLLLGLALDL